MNNIISKSSKWFLGSLFCLGVVTSCDLDYENRGDINADGVWESKEMIVAYLNDIHGGEMPGWPSGSNDNDEAMQHNATTMSDWARGVIDAEKDGKKWDYGYIDKINFLLMKLEEVPATVLSEEDKKLIAGQALFWRAWDYWGKVNVFGGVPLITEWQNVNDKPSLFVPRSSTTDCMKQIVADLDKAIEYLPMEWDEANYGRIDRTAALAFKGRVLLNYASPLFNRNNDQERWQNAYKANKIALDELRKAGKGLVPKYAKIWQEEQNEEVIMLNQYFYPGHSTTGYLWSLDDKPILPLLLAYPLKDGSSLELDKNRFANDEAYNADFLDKFYNDRDDRFYATIHCGGQHYPSKDDELGGELEGMNYWCNWYINEEGSYNTLLMKQMGGNDNFSITGFNCVKGNDQTKRRDNKDEGESDWIEIRFAEVMLNFAECAVEIGNTSEALGLIYQLRERAGIEAGDGRYGVLAASQSDVREAVHNERYVELAFEGHRSNDLRRWMQWGNLNNTKHRHGLYLVMKNNADLDTFDWSSSIHDAEPRSKFEGVYIENLDGDDKYTFNYSLNHWFWPLHKELLDRNSKLEQNNEWGGKFDPLK